MDMNMNMHYNALQREKDVIFSLIYIYVHLTRFPLIYPDSYSA